MAGFQTSTEAPGPLPACLPDPSCLTLNEVFWQGGIMMMIVSATAIVVPVHGVEFLLLTCTVDIAGHCAISFARFKTVIASHPQVAMAEHVEGLAD
jgi:hypothetical protein